MSNAAIKAGDFLRIEKGCPARNINKYTKAYVVEVRNMGAEYSHSVLIVLSLPGRAAVSFYARHANRLCDDVISMNDGNPLHTIKVRRALNSS